MRGLTPRTDHSYIVSVSSPSGAIQGEGSGPGYGFRTFPVGPRRITFIVYGDSRTNADRHRKVIQAIQREKDIDFVLHTGDLVTDGTDASEWVPQFFQPAGGLMRRVPFYTELGNHRGRLFSVFPVHGLAWR